MSGTEELLTNPEVLNIDKLNHNSNNSNLNDKLIPVSDYAPEFVDTDLDIPQICVDADYFQYFMNYNTQQNLIYDVMLAHKVLQSGNPNRYGSRIPIVTNWNTKLLDMFLLDYEDREVTEWLTYGFSISRDNNIAQIWPAQGNHASANAYPLEIDEYIITELKYNATMGPFTVPPFLGGMGVSPLSTHPKKESNKRRVILDLSYPFGSAVNDGISKDEYCRVQIKLTYPMVDTLAK